MARPSKKNLALATQTGESDPRAPLDWQAFLAAAAPVMKVLKADLGQRQKASPAVSAALLTRYEADKADRKTADSQIEWTERFIEQVAAAWMLSCVFIRTLEDRGLLSHARLAGPGAADSFKAFLELAPSLNERDYLLTVFHELRHFPATRGLFDARHNPVWLLTPSADGAKALIALFTGPSREAPAFRFGQADTAFLGWIYQDLDEGVRARFALLQTPRFVEAFILDRTLEPALATFGLGDTTLIDPTCGSGHFLLGAFERLFLRWMAAEPGLGERSAAHKALDAVYGADINPYAVAIARFRLTLAFLERGGFKRLSGAPVPPLHLVVADSLLHNPHVQQIDLAYVPTADAYMAAGAAYRFENDTDAREVLHRRFAAVVGNPPYITVKDAVLRERYRELYPRSAAGKYSIAAPFTERFFQLAKAGGRIGMITANSFMKREFGKKLIEQYLPSVNLDAVINTSGAYIPGHGTPTVLLFGANEPPKGTDVLTVLANRGEPATPDDPEQGHVWRSIADHWAEPGFENDYISVARTSRDTLGKHPWSLGGGGAAELKELLEERAEKRLGELADSIGFMAITGEDDAFVAPADFFRRLSLPSRRFGIGELIRDWSFSEGDHVLFDYTDKWNHTASPPVLKHLWPWRTRLSQRLMFGKTQLQAGHHWSAYKHVGTQKVATPLSIAFAEVATHNHFVLDRGGKVFKQTAPIIKLPPTATEDDHLALLAYLNSSTACFWMKQVLYPKGMHNASESNSTPFLQRFACDGSKLSKLPLPEGFASFRDQLAHLAGAMCDAADERHAITIDLNQSRRMQCAFESALERRMRLLERMVALQEEIDWTVYGMFGLAELDRLTPGEVGGVALGLRPFEIELGLALGQDLEKSWFDWHETKPGRLEGILDGRQRDVYAARVHQIRKAGSLLALLETPSAKRRWVQPSGKAAQYLETDDKVLVEKLRLALEDLGEMEAPKDKPFSSRVLADRLNPVWNDISEWLVTRGQSQSVSEYCETNSAPFLAAYRFTEPGLEKHAEWEKTWELQRREDAGENVGRIPVPPKYAQGDYRATTSWQLRGPLDVPKERFISYPGCESDEDHEPVYGWAGWDHEQRAKALATLYWQRKTDEQWPKDRLTPMLAGLLELLPWLRQWHADPSDDYGGDSPAAYFAGFLDTECRAFDLTHTELRAWRPPEKTRGKKATTPRAAKTPKPESDGTPEKKPRAPRKPRTSKTTPQPDSDGDSP